MNILFFAHESRMGGANLSLLGMIDELHQKHNIYVVVPIKKGFLVDELKKRKIPVLYRHSFWWMLAPESSAFKTLLKKMLYKLLCLNNYCCARSLKRYVKDWNIDVIHTNSGVINTGGILSEMTSVSHVWHLREFGQEDFGFFSVWNYDKLCHFIDSHSTKIIAISQAIAEKFEKLVTKAKLQVVYNGVSEANILYKTEVKDSRSRIEFLMSGRISAEKGQEEAIRAVGLLVKKGYRNLHLSIAGPGESDALEKLIAEENLQEYVSMLGFIENMPYLRKNMDVELVCSVCEGFGRVTAEAMMSSNPVIGSNTGGTPEVIRDGENGYLYEKGNVEELAQKMEIFLKNPEKIRFMGNVAYTDSNSKFTRKRNAQEIEQIYTEIK